MSLATWWARLIGAHPREDEDTRETARQFAEATAPGPAPTPVDVALAEMIAAANAAAAAARRQARMTPPPRQRAEPLPSIPEDF